MPQGGLSLLASALASAPSPAELLPALLLGLLDAGALHRLVPDVLSACSGSNQSSSSLMRWMASKKLLVDTGAPRSRRCPQNRAEGDGGDPVEQDHGPEEEERDEEQRRRHVQPAGQGPGVARLVAWRR